ncbi:F0F1 ATP synthase subunit B [Phaeovulum sp.]|uniref:F0F1 ATP synthase subunit B family protein n=1 Tax=Phaeovulum sp. TaxID=2934796 RepID=UPI0039E71655
MSVDWITVAAQIANFLVLVWLLKRFLYRPILDGIDARETEIATRMGEAHAIRKTAEAAEADYKAQIASLRADRADMLAEARRTAEAERSALLAEARAQLVAEQAKHEDERREEARRYTADLHTSGAKALLALTRKALADLADETLEQRIAAHAVARLGPVAADLRKAAGAARDAEVLTRDPLPEEVRAHLKDELALVIPGFGVQFRADPDLAPGLTLRLGGGQVAWTVDSYLDGLEDVLDDRTAQLLVKGRTDAA